MTLKSFLILLAAGASLIACGNDGRVLPAAPAGVVGTGCSSDADCEFEGGTCLTTLPGGYCTTDCASACPADAICAEFGEDEVCAFGCSADTDCRNGYFCDLPVGGSVGICDALGSSRPSEDAGLDVPITDAGADVPPSSETNYGAACTSDVDCVAANGLPERCLPDSQFPGGYCSASCAEGIDECGDGAVCLDTSVGGLCMAPCDVPAECRSSYECCSVEASAACLPAGLTGQCVTPDPGTEPEPEPEPEGAELGESCADDTDCGAGESPRCFNQVPGGYCTSDCTDDSQCGGGVCANLGGFSLCLAPCGADGECSNDLECCNLGFGDSCLPSAACF
jgi:hypothetical protein